MPGGATFERSAGDARFVNATDVQNPQKGGGLWHTLVRTCVRRAAFGSQRTGFERHPEGMRQIAANSSDTISARCSLQSPQQVLLTYFAATGVMSISL